VNRALSASGSTHAIFRNTFASTRTSLIKGTVPLVMEMCFPNREYTLNQSEWCHIFENGSLAVSPPATVTCRLLQNSYTISAQSSQIATVKPKCNLPRKQCYFTEEQVYEALLKHEGKRSKAAKELDCHVRTIDNYIARFPSLQDVMHDRKVGICDQSEEVLKKHNAAGNPGTAQFFLKNLHPDYGPKGGNKTELIATPQGMKLSVQSLGMTEEDQAAA
jgi:hypothetical protein